MTGIEPRTSGIGSDRSTNWGTTTALPNLSYAMRLSLSTVGTYLTSIEGLTFWLVGYLIEEIKVPLFAFGPITASSRWFLVVKNQKNLSDH